MKINFDKKKIADATSELMHKTVDTSKKVAFNTKKNVENVIEKAKRDSLSRKLKKLNPVFPEQYLSEEFNVPNIITIVDDAVRKDEKLCEGAIGFLKNEKDVEILCLYDESIEFSKLQFIPAPLCDATYYIDSFDRNRFIRTDCIFCKAHEEKIAELKYIAHCLGAKRCSIEIDESVSGMQVQNRSASVSESVYGVPVQESTESSSSQSESNKRSGKVQIEFEGNTTCVQPELKWFSYDDNIKRLIRRRVVRNKNYTPFLSFIAVKIVKNKNRYFPFTNATIVFQNKNPIPKLREPPQTQNRH